jgi:hypothetical protein
MGSPGVRDEMERLWQVADREEQDSKLSGATIEAVLRWYRRLAQDQREEADLVICEWLRAREPRRQFDALALVDRIGIQKALPILRELQSESERRSDPAAPYDWARFNRVIGRLVDH